MEIELKNAGWQWRTAYWLADFWDGNPPQNLCPFIRHAFYGVSKVTVVAVATAIVVTGAVIGAVSGLYVSLIGPILYWLIGAGALSFLSIDLLALGFGSTLFMLVLGVAFLYSTKALRPIDLWIRSKFLKNEQKASKPRTPTPLEEWMKAKHDQICPEVNFKR